jgi:hypothetical protein
MGPEKRIFSSRTVRSSRTAKALTKVSIHFLGGCALGLLRV